MELAAHLIDIAGSLTSISGHLAVIAGSMTIVVLGALAPERLRQRKTMVLIAGGIAGGKLLNLCGAYIRIVGPRMLAAY